MKYTITTSKGKERGLFMGDNLEGLKKTIKYLGHTIVEIKTENGTSN